MIYGLGTKAYLCGLAIFALMSVSASAATLNVLSTAAIFGAGSSNNLDGTPPPVFNLPIGTGRVLTFSSVTGSAKCDYNANFYNGPDGGTCVGLNATDINSANGISGIIDSSSTLFLVGVLLDNSPPSGTGPARLNFSTGMIGENFTDLWPVLSQTFFIGDGITGHGDGSPQKFHIPDSATRLFLGFADAYRFSGNPGYYYDNSGSMTATFDVSIGGTTIDLWSQFPDTQGENGIYAYGYSTANGTYRQLVDTGSYRFETPNQPFSDPAVRKESDGWIELHPAGLPQCGIVYGQEDSVLAYHVAQTGWYKVTGSFMMNGVGSIAMYIKKNSQVLWQGTLPTKGVVDFSLTHVSLNAGDYLYFGTNSNGPDMDDWGHVKALISSSSPPVPNPVPAIMPLLLFN